MRTILLISLFLATSLSYGVKFNDDVVEKKPKQSQEQNINTQNSSTSQQQKNPQPSAPLGKIMQKNRHEKKEILYNNFLKSKL